MYHFIIEKYDEFIARITKKSRWHEKLLMSAYLFLRR